MLTDGRTDRRTYGGGKVITVAHPEHSSGELKITKENNIFFVFKTKNCSDDDCFISCNGRIEKMLYNICMSAVSDK